VTTLALAADLAPISLRGSSRQATSSIGSGVRFQSVLRGCVWRVVELLATLLPFFGTTPAGQSAWLALPDAGLCAPMFIADFDDCLSIFAAWDGTSLA
jgi:hypothetical protein